MRIGRKRLLAGIFVLVPALWLSFIHPLAGGGSDAPRPRSAQIVFGMGWEPVSFYPLRGLDSASYYAQSLVYEGLVRYDERMRIVPGLAESFSVSENGLVYRFKLRRGLRFSTGEGIAVPDVVASIKLAADRQSPYYFDYEDIASVRGEGQADVVVELRKPCAPLISRMVELRILPERLLKLADHGRSVLSRQPVASGPFALASWQSAAELVFEANRYYWGPAPSTKRLVWRVIPDPSLLALALKGGEIDVGQVDARSASFLSKSPHIALARFSGSRTIYLGFNTARKPFDDSRVRQAIARSIDVAEIIKGIYRGLASPASTDFLTGGWACHSALRPWPYAPALAAESLAESGFVRRDGTWVKDGRRLCFSILTVRDYRDVAELVGQYLARSGIMTETQIVDFSTLRQSYLNRGAFDAVLWSRSVGPDPECVLAWHSRGRLNFSRFRDRRLDDALEAGRVTTSRAARQKAYWLAQEILCREVPCVFLLHPDLLIAHDRRITNVEQPGQKESGLPWDNPLFNAARWAIKGDWR